MIAALYVLFVFNCLFLIMVVLLQAGKGDGLAGVFGGGGGSGTILGNRGAATFLSKLTVASAVLFMLLSVILAFDASRSESRVGRGSTDPEETPGMGAEVEEGDETEEGDESSESGEIDLQLGNEIEIGELPFELSEESAPEEPIDEVPVVIETSEEAAPLDDGEPPVPEEAAPATEDEAPADEGSEEGDEASLPVDP